MFTLGKQEKKLDTFFGLEFWLEILAWNSRPKFSARFFQARIPGWNFGLGPDILAWPEISARRWIDPMVTCLKSNNDSIAVTIWMVFLLRPGAVNNSPVSSPPASGDHIALLLHFVAPRGNKNKAMITSGRSMIWKLFFLVSGVFTVVIVRNMFFSKSFEIATLRPACTNKQGRECR